MAKIAINGFGRIGRLFFRQAFQAPGIDIIAVNDLGDISNLAYLLRRDTVYGAYDCEVKADSKTGTLTVNGKEIKVLREKNPARLPWRALGIDVVVEATGLFESFEKSKPHLVAGAKRVVITAPAEDDDGPEGRTVFVGINEDELKSHPISSNGSCTTNAAFPVIEVMAENPGIEKAILNTVHGYTATQNLVDGPVKGGDPRRGRAAAQNIVPSTTGAAIAVTRAIPELNGKFDGIALRVPVVSGSVADITFVSKRITSAEEINEIFRKAAESPRWKGIMKLSDEQLVSSDILKEPYGAIVDASFTRVVDGNLVKVLSWYDNEWGYAAMLLRHVLSSARHT